MQRKEENGFEFADDGSGVMPHSNRHQTKPRLPREYGENGDVTTQADGEIDKSSATEAKHHLELRPQASWTFSSAAKIDLKKSKSSSHEGQVFMDEAKRFILFYAESAITVKDLDNNTQETYQYPSPANPCLFILFYLYLCQTQIINNH
jgi:hypothetical protein